MVWKQFRRVDIGELRVEDLDMDISLDLSRDKGLQFDIKIWNLSSSSWQKVSQGSRTRVMLGWENGVQKNVMDGVVNKKNSSQDGDDVVFRIKGQDKTQELVKFKMTRTWTNTEPQQIAKEIGNTIGLSAGNIESVGQKMSRWTMTRDKSVRHWLDQLVNEAQKMTDFAWEWFVDAGKLYFVRKDTRKDQAVVLSYQNSLLSIGEASSKGSKKAAGLKFENLMEPRIRQGGSVIVETDEYSGPYKVTSYKMRSNSVSGDHMVSGKLSPLDVEYSVDYA